MYEIACEKLHTTSKKHSTKRYEYRNGHISKWDVCYHGAFKTVSCKMFHNTYLIMLLNGCGLTYEEEVIEKDVTTDNRHNKYIGNIME